MIDRMELSSLLRVDGIDVYYGKSEILRGASIEIAAGEMVALLGRNGAGKTTLLKAIMGSVKPKKGGINWRGQDICAVPAHRRSKLGIGYVPQDRHLFLDLTVSENMIVVARKRESQAIEDALELFPALRERWGRRAASLSGGEQQMLAIARALAVEPQLLIIDEATTGLMPIAVSAVQEVVQRLNQERGLAVLLVEERVPFSTALANRFYFLEQGEMAFQCDKESLFGQEEDPLLRYVGVSR